MESEEVGEWTSEEKKLVEKINEMKTWFFEKINKVNKPLARVTRKKERGLK